MIVEGTTSWIGLKDITQVSNSLISYSAPVRRAFVGLKLDWIKTRRHIYGLCVVCPPEDDLYLYLRQCAIAWRDLGNVLGYSEPPLRVGCVYPRCNGSSDPQWACALCLEGSYCTRQCQQKYAQFSLLKCVGLRELRVAGTGSLLTTRTGPSALADMTETIDMVLRTIGAVGV